MQKLIAILAGALFGSGLYISGMTNTEKVQGWLDVFGNWDPTLAFVMGGAIIPMAVAWQLARVAKRPLAAQTFPPKPLQEIDRKLIIGSVLFGFGWGLAGFCPGPAVASLSFGGWPGVVFLIAMLGGMLLAPPLRARLDSYVPAE